MVSHLRTKIGFLRVAGDEYPTVKLQIYPLVEFKSYDTLCELLEDNIHDAHMVANVFDMWRQASQIAKQSRRGSATHIIGPSLKSPPALINWIMNYNSQMTVQSERSLIHWHLYYEGHHNFDSPFQKVGGKYYSHPDIKKLLVRIAL